MGSLHLTLQKIRSSPRMNSSMYGLLGVGS